MKMAMKCPEEFKLTQIVNNIYDFAELNKGSIPSFLDAIKNGFFETKQSKMITSLKLDKND